MCRKKIIVFASGTKTGGGTGFEKIAIASQDGSINADVIAVVSNHSNGGVRQRANRLNVPFIHFPMP